MFQVLDLDLRAIKLLRVATPSDTLATLTCCVEFVKMEGRCCPGSKASARTLT